MKVTTKKFNVGMEVKTNGIEFGVRDGNGNFSGDCYLTKTGLIWCEGRTTKSNGKQIDWTHFIRYMSRRA